MNISSSGLRLLMARESVRLKAYKDQRGIWTIGVGHTSMAGPPEVQNGLVLTYDQVQNVFMADVQKFVAGVNAALRHPATQCQFDAMVSLCYNIGINGFQGSTVIHMFNAGAIASAANAFLMWEHPASLAARRQSERRQFLGEGS